MSASQTKPPAAAAGPDPAKIDLLLAQFVRYLGAVLHGQTVVVGEKLGSTSV